MRVEQVPQRVSMRSYKRDCWNCDATQFSASASYCPSCGADLDGAEPEHRLWNTIQREGLDENPWDRDPLVIPDEIGVGKQRLSLRARVADSLGVDPEEITLVSRVVGDALEDAEGWQTHPVPEVLEE